MNTTNTNTNPLMHVTAETLNDRASALDAVARAPRVTREAMEREAGWLALMAVALITEGGGTATTEARLITHESERILGASREPRRVKSAMLSMAAETLRRLSRKRWAERGVSALEVECSRYVADLRSRPLGRAERAFMCDVAAQGALALRYTGRGYVYGEDTPDTSHVSADAIDYLYRRELIDIDIDDVVTLTGRGYDEIG